MELWGSVLPTFKAINMIVCVIFDTSVIISLYAAALVCVACEWVRVQVSCGSHVTLKEFLVACVFP